MKTLQHAVLIVALVACSLQLFTRACQVDSFDISFVSGPSSSSPLSNRFSAADLNEFFSVSEIQMKNTLTTPIYCVDAREGTLFALLKFLMVAHF